MLSATAALIFVLLDGREAKILACLDSRDLNDAQI